jgi:hypothetical protein
MQRQVLLPDSSIVLHATDSFLLIADSGAQTAHSTRVDGTWIFTSFHRFSPKSQLQWTAAMQGRNQQTQAFSY